MITYAVKILIIRWNSSGARAVQGFVGVDKRVKQQNSVTDSVPACSVEKSLVNINYVERLLEVNFNGVDGK